jgi:glutathione peroxidase
MLFYNLYARLINDEEFSFKRLDGKLVLIVNTASACGNTIQYKGLEKLYKKFRHQNFEILAFPCNQFGQQEQASSSEIKSFCEINYNISFMLFEKVNVREDYKRGAVEGPPIHPVFKFLIADEKENIKWNFTKFLISKTGEKIKRFEPEIQPEELEDEIINNL